MTGHVQIGDLFWLDVTRRVKRLEKRSWRGKGHRRKQRPTMGSDRFRTAPAFLLFAERLIGRTIRVRALAP